MSRSERVIRIQLENLNELGDVVQKSLMVEIMGKHSNIILVDEKNTIVDSIKHINGLTSSVRQVLPGLDYFIPNTQHKINPYEVTTNDWNETLFIKPVSIAKMLYGSLSGFSSSLSHELAYRSHLDGDAPTASLNGNDKSALMEQFRSIMQQTKGRDFSPCIVFRGAKPIDFGAFSFAMYTDCTCKIYESMSEVVETFYGEKDTLERIRQKSIDLRKSVTNILERNYKKRDMQYKQLKKTDGKEKYKVYGELLTTYGYQLSETDTSLTCVNYYNNEEITIPVDETMTAIENANKYFARYNKLKRTEEAVKEQQEYNQKICGNCYNQEYLGYVFVDAMGNLIQPDSVTTGFPQLLKENGLRRIRFHDLRHSCASLLLKQGVPMKQIQEWLGHSDISTTANIYAHLDSQSKQLSAATMEKALALPAELPESRW